MQNALSSFRRGLARLAGAVILGLLPPLAAGAEPDPSALCDRAAALAAQATGVPVSVLKAIALNETGRKRGGAFRPWPWTVNMEGKGLWFETEAEARAYAEERYAAGARSFDIGCFQINHKWHGEHFTSIQQMFDPVANGLYAAKFLKSLYAESGDWSAAAGAYHSRNPEFAEKYAARFDRFRSGLREEDLNAIPEVPALMLAALGAEAAEPAAPRVNRYPLLQGASGGGGGGTGTGLGSLVPIGNGGGASLFARPAGGQP